MKLNRLEKAAIFALFTLGFCGCGGEAASTLPGTYTYQIVGPVQCNNGQSPSGTIVIYEGPGGVLSGEYDICNRGTAATDLGGRDHGRRFELTLFLGTINVINGVAAPDALAGDVVGLGDGVTFQAQRVGARSGKQGPDINACAPVGVAAVLHRR